MTPKFLTNGEAQKRIAELEAQVKAATSSPVRNIADDEALVAQMKSDRLKREAAKGASNAAPANPAAVAVQARLEAGKAALAAAEAKVRAKQAVAAIQPAATVTAAEFAAQIAPPTMARSEWQKLDPAARSEWFRRGGKLSA